MTQKVISSLSLTFLSVRKKSANIHKYGQACFFPHAKEKPEYYENFKPLNENDVKDIKTEIERLLKEEKFSDSEWGLS